MQLFYRRLGDGAAVFNSSDWQTHILTPSAAIIFEALAEIRDGASVPQHRALALLHDELEVDTNTPEMQQVLRSLREMGMLGG